MFLSIEKYYTTNKENQKQQTHIYLYKLLIKDKNYNDDSACTNFQ